MKTRYAPHLNVVGINALGGWGVQTGGLRDSDGTEGGDPTSDMENSEEWMLFNFKSWLHHLLCTSGKLPVS